MGLLVRRRISETKGPRIGEQKPDRNDRCLVFQASDKVTTTTELDSRRQRKNDSMDQRLQLPGNGRGVSGCSVGGIRYLGRCPVVRPDLQGEGQWAELHLKRGCSFQVSGGFGLCVSGDLG